MSKTLKNFYTLAPADFKPGDVFACVVTLHHVGDMEDGTPDFRMYRCEYPDPQLSVDGIPQGSPIIWDKNTVRSLFSVALSAIEIAKEQSKGS